MVKYGPDAQTKALLEEVGSFVVLALFPDGVVRVVAAPKGEDTAHEVARAIADQGYLVWFADLWTDEVEAGAASNVTRGRVNDEPHRRPAPCIYEAPAALAAKAEAGEALYEALRDRERRIQLTGRRLTLTEQALFEGRIAVALARWEAVENG